MVRGGDRLKADPTGGRQVENLSYGAHDAVLESLNGRDAVEAAAKWSLDGNWSGGQAERKHDSLENAVDAVIAMLGRTSRQ